MRYLILLITLCLTSHSQTVIRGGQVLGGLPSPVPSVEAQWCPAPALALQAPDTLIVGPNWSVERPCYFHFNLAPPATVDPIHASSMTAGATIKINPGAQLGDIYIYAQPPAFGTTPRPTRIMVGLKRPQDVVCTGCTVETQSTQNGVTIFPAFSIPIGVATIVPGGRFHPWLDTILDSKQLYIGANLGITFRRDQGGGWLELSPTLAVQANAQARIMNAEVNTVLSRLNSETRNAQSALPPLAELENLRKYVDVLSKDLMELRGLLPRQSVLKTAKELEENLNQKQFQIEQLASVATESHYMTLQTQTDQVQNTVENFRNTLSDLFGMEDPPTDPKKECLPRSMALDKEHLWVCGSNKRWGRIKLSKIK